jgi:hypothetical protein
MLCEPVMRIFPRDGRLIEQSLELPMRVLQEPAATKFVIVELIRVIA